MLAFHRDPSDCEGPEGSCCVHSYYQRNDQEVERKKIRRYRCHDADEHIIMQNQKQTLEVRRNNYTFT